MQEKERRLKNCSGDAPIGLKQDLEGLQEKLKKEVEACKLGNKLGQLGSFINENIIISHNVKDQTLTPSRKRWGEEDVWFYNKKRENDNDKNPIWQTGDTLRGEIHKESYYAAITQYTKDKDGNVLLNNGKPKIDPTIWYVIHRELTYFDDWKPLEKVIVDKNLYKLMKEQFPDGTSFKKSLWARFLYDKERKGQRT